MPKIWAIADLHLAFSNPDKSMEFFGPLWKNYTDRIQEYWKDVVAPEDLVLIAGDITWAMRLDAALIDLKWIDALPGTKAMIRGNHDYWWASNSKMQQVMPSSIHFIQNNAWEWNGVAIGGSRLWDSDEYRFDSIIRVQENPRASKESKSEREDSNDAEKIFVRELERLRLSLNQLNPKAHLRIAMTHYPPIGLELKPSRASKILEEYKIDICVFGHLHSIETDKTLFGTARGVRYELTSCDYLDFKPLLLIDSI